MTNEWNRNKLAGNIAENMVEFLINSIPYWKCNKFGVESHIKEIKDMIRKSTARPITTKIRSMPDFIAFNEKTGEIFFIEVKRRSASDEGGYPFTYLENYNEYWKGTKLIIVRKNKPYFTWVDLEKIKNSMKTMKKINGEDRYHWDFGEIEQDIKTLFSDLKEEIIIKAMESIKLMAPKGDD